MSIDTLTNIFQSSTSHMKAFFSSVLWHGFWKGSFLVVLNFCDHVVAKFEEESCTGKRNLALPLEVVREFCTVRFYIVGSMPLLTHVHMCSITWPFRFYAYTKHHYPHGNHPHRNHHHRHHRHHHILIISECPLHTQVFSSNQRSMFNWTATYRLVNNVWIVILCIQYNMYCISYIASYVPNY